MSSKIRTFWPQFKFYLIIIILAAIYIIPLYATIVTSLKTNQEIVTSGYLSWPVKMTFENFKEAFKELNILKTYAGTGFITVMSIIGSVLLTALAAYAFAFLRFKGNFPLFVIFVSGMFVPLQVAIIPMYYLSSALGLFDSYYAQILAHVGWTIPIGTLILRNYFKNVPYALIEAAKVDGLSHLGTFRKIILPLAKPAIGVLLIFEFTWIWNSFLWGLVLSQLKAVPIMVLIQNKLNNLYYITWGLQAAGVILAALPVLIVFLLFQRYFIKGLTMGAIK